MTTIGVFAAIFDEEEQILCVKRNYGPRNWTVPGGRMEPGESPLEALAREVAEESGYEMAVERLVGVYSMAFKDDLVLFFAGKAVARRDWQPDGEISVAEFYPLSALPQPMNPRTAARIRDAVEGRVGRVCSQPEFPEDIEDNFA
jgi:ADP-ribose pyrophosphatase YjhB (NUDIX family)